MKSEKANKKRRSPSKIKPSSSFILSIDQGTTGTRVALVDPKGILKAKAYRPFKQIYPQAGWVEHNPKDIWNTLLFCMETLFKENPTFQANQIVSIGITNQRETVVVWDSKTGEPVHNAIVWQCRRTEPFCERLKKDKLESFIYKKSGLPVDPYFSASKIRWILKNKITTGEKGRAGSKKAAQKSRHLLAGTIDTYLLWKLSGGLAFKTDLTNASRTQLMNLKKQTWDSDLLHLFGLNKYENLLPEIVPSGSIFGHTYGLKFLPDNIPISGMIGDQQSALFGQRIFQAGAGKCTFGTGSFLLVNVGSKPVFSKHRLIATPAWQIKGQNPVYALEGGAFICGAAIQWLRDHLGLINEAKEIETLAMQVPSTEGVQFVPAFAGLGAPHWESSARGVLFGVSRACQPAHIARACLEGLALQNAEILQCMEKDLKKKVKTIQVDGGAAVNNLLMQLQADYSDRIIERGEQVESTCLGAAYMAGLASGFWLSIDELKRLPRGNVKQFRPALSPKKRRERFDSWKKALKASLLSM